MKVLSLFLPEIRELLAEKNFRDLRRALDRIDPMDLADGWEVFTPEEQAVLFRLMPRRRAALLFEELEPAHQAALFQHVREVDLKELVTDLDPSGTSKLLRQLPEKMTRRLTSLMRKDSLVTVQKLLEYPRGTVGSRMRTRLFLLRPDWTVKQALERLRVSVRLRHIEETFVENLYVAGEEGKLHGEVTLKELVVAPGELRVSEMSHQTPTALYPEMDQEEAGRLFSHYKLTSAPVLDTEGRILGVVLSTDVFEVLQEETEEDFAKMAGTRTEEFSARTAIGAAKVRFPWLIATCVGQLGVSAIVRSYEETLARLVALATFMPFIAAMGGNVGTQAATVMVRGLATGEFRDEDLTSAIWREVRVGALLGGFYALIVGAVAYLLYGSRFGPWFSGVVAAGMMVSMTTASSLGALWPFLLRRFGFDPATATGPLITTTTDLLSTVTYFTLANWLLIRFLAG